ncbi:MAG: hypothetical protein JNL70_01205 [Saprospiraceae bacterium]|nr:hypothetical protein [Saprospiraceae bacterium]
MKNRHFHFIYLAIIGFLVFQVWAKSQALNEAVRSIEHFEKLLKADVDISNKMVVMIKNGIDKNVLAYVNEYNTAFGKKAIKSMEISRALMKWLDKQKEDFINQAGGFYKKDSLLINNRLSSRLSGRFFTDQKIQAIKDSLGLFQAAIFDVSEEWQLKDIEKKSEIEKLLKNEAYWQQLKNKTNSDVLAQFEALKNQINLDVSLYLNYIYSMVNYTGMIFDSYKIAVFGQKSALIEGETVRADFYLSHYSSNVGKDVSFFINNREIPFKEGIAHFEKTEMTVGKKTVKAIARIQNPLTGQVTITEGEFEYEVLPKCSRDCQ